VVTFFNTNSNKKLHYAIKSLIKTTGGKNIGKGILTVCPIPMMYFPDLPRKGVGLVLRYCLGILWYKYKLFDFVHVGSWEGWTLRR
jgi:hypothetical protein